MVHEAISIAENKVNELKDVSRALRRAHPKLVGPKGEKIDLPESLRTLLKGAVRTLAAGQSVVLIPQEKQLTTQQAGELLGMSRPYVIRLLDAGEMPFTLVGKHRRVALRDVLAFARRQAERKSVLDKMARDAYGAGLYHQHAGMPEGGRDK
ncbi:MAG: helix-turn-helix domain-containing protein [Bryobacterales bacterium]|nr:helix-turn-helix domain-containing protein [Bryobacterales bacterium]